MAVKTVTLTLNGQTYDLTYDASSGTYKGTFSAPNTTSWNQANHVYSGTVTATDDAGNSITKTAADFAGLNVRVKEVTKPNIAVNYPTASAFITTAKPTIRWTVTDAGSGIDTATLSITIDGKKYTSGIATATTTNGYVCTYTPGTALGEGAHTVSFAVSDNDGNSASASSVTFTVDTVPPTLSVANPANGYITNKASLTVSGTTSDETSGPVSVTVNGSAATLSGANWSKTITLKEGSNTITVVAKDAAGKTSTVTRTVTLDTKAPTISAITITPNPVNVGASYTITVTVSD